MYNTLVFKIQYKLWLIQHGFFFCLIIQESSLFLFQLSIISWWVSSICLLVQRKHHESPQPDHIKPIKPPPSSLLLPTSQSQIQISSASKRIYHLMHIGSLPPSLSRCTLYDFSKYYLHILQFKAFRLFLAFYYYFNFLPCVCFFCRKWFSIY